MYLMISTYLRQLDEVDAARDDHFAFLEKLEADGLVVTAGRQSPPTGGVVLLDVPTEEQAREVMAGDPYVQRGLAAYTAIGWLLTRGALAGWKRPTNN